MLHPAKVRIAVHLSFFFYHRRCFARNAYFDLSFCVGFVAGFGRKLSQQFQKKSSSDLQDNKSHSPSLPSSPVGTPELGSRKSVRRIPRHLDEDIFNF